MKDREERMEQTVERVLAGLRASEPAAGMNTRILRALRDGAPGRAGAVWGLLRVATAAAACAAVAAILLAALRMEHPLVRPASSRVETRTALPALNAPKRIAEIAPRSLDARFDEHAAPTTARARRVRVIAPRLVSTVNHPAPPLPLTEQEKLLLLLAQHRKSVNLAILNPEEQAKQIAEERKSFAAFFAKKTSEQLIAEREKEQQQLLAERENLQVPPTYKTGDLP